ncbi:unnamed protein product [Linum tenue]|uniref:Uncharacterized protein n=1 Tax=Linum tenue TaxID=586396 RepID=A0AAV0J251_9ROSI|nr:unnamed protein product [Linum tenue]
MIRQPTFMASGRKELDEKEGLRRAEENGDAMKLFGPTMREDKWYVAYSDSKDVVAAMKEEEDVVEENFDSRCPALVFFVAEKVIFRRE